MYFLSIFHGAYVSVRPRRNANHTFLLLHVTPLTLIWRLPSLKGEKGRKNLVCRLMVVAGYS